MANVIKNTWSGMITSIKSYWTEFKRLVMSSGLMEYLETNLRAIRDWAAKLYESGQLQTWAGNVATSIINLGEDIQDFIYDTIGDWDAFSAKISSVFSTLRAWINQTMPILKAFFKLLQGVNAVLEAVGVHGMIRHAANIGSQPPSYQTGTGPAGLPNTGLYYGHKGEIVKSPQESAMERSGQGGGGAVFNISVAPTFMSGDANAARTVVAEIKRELNLLNVRWGTA